MIPDLKNECTDETRRGLLTRANEAVSAAGEDSELDLLDVVIDGSKGQSEREGQIQNRRGREKDVWRKTREE